MYSYKIKAGKRDGKTESERKNITEIIERTTTATVES